MLTHEPHVPAKREIVSSNYSHFSTITPNSRITHLKKSASTQHCKRNPERLCDGTLMEWLRCSCYITHQRAVKTERDREWMDEDREREWGTVKGYFPTWWNQAGDLMLLSNACKPRALPSPVQESTVPVNRAACCSRCVFFFFFFARINPTKHTLLKCLPP